MELVLHPTTLNESNPISIHKIVDDEVVLLPGEQREVTFLVFPRRAGLHALKGFKVVDRLLKGDKEHEAKGGYSFSYPKFSVEDRGGGN